MQPASHPPIPDPPPMTRVENEHAPDSGRGKARGTLAKVLIVQAVALSLLGFLQILYTP